MKHNTLKELDELIRELSINKSSDSKGNFVDVLGLGQSCLDDLINDLLTVRVVGSEHFSPKFLTLSFNEVASLHAVQVILVGHFDKLIVALTPGTLVGSEG